MPDGERAAAQSPGPRPLRGRMESRFSLEGLSERKMMKTDGDTAPWLKTWSHEKSQEGMRDAGIPGCWGLFVETPQDQLGSLRMGWKRITGRSGNG